MQFLSQFDNKEPKQTALAKIKKKLNVSALSLSYLGYKETAMEFKMTKGNRNTDQENLVFSRMLASGNWSRKICQGRELCDREEGSEPFRGGFERK